ncbi:autophagy-related protein 13 homolog [Homalodisca vitripennis]|uniref:autophagy-related protein 13 homolog n=1 Tax=Homalodisca vitripennis TaxID=197043 RepID=UPI001EEA9A59|nr:autophagy-related protein 13 homolog [Homalodisca vitripennis]
MGPNLLGQTQESEFNLAIKDLPEVLAEAKKAMGSSGSRLPLCVEISLRTNEQETMMLETWCIGIRTDLVDPTMRVTYPLYTRMGILLKSLVTLTRVTPAYKLSRNKSDYVMCYRIYVGEPQLLGLGSGYTQMNVGQVGTSLGTLQMSVAYRTKLTISPQHTKTSAIMVKSDHFPSDSSPSDNNTKNCSDTKMANNGLPMVKLPAFADRWDLRWKEPEPVEIPFAHLLPKPKSKQSPPTQDDGEDAALNGNESVDNDGSFVAVNGNKNCSDSADSQNGNVTPKVGSLGSQYEEPFSMDDVVPVVPFAGPLDEIELGLFFRRCQRPPPLKSFTEIDKPEVYSEDREDISEELESLETNVLECNDIISSLCDGENNN